VAGAAPGAAGGEARSEQGRPGAAGGGAAGTWPGHGREAAGRAGGGLARAAPSVHVGRRAEGQVPAGGREEGMWRRGREERRRAGRQRALQAAAADG
jgi:hypothetical protein